MFKSVLKRFTLIMMVFLIASCNSSKKEELKAENQLRIIENLLEKNELNSAKIKIDSFHINFRKLVNKRRIAAAFEDTISRRESHRTLMYCDSLYPIKKKEFDSIAKNFRFEKDTVYQQYGNYIHKTQLTEQNSERNYLKCIVDENAGLNLISNYSGTKIVHKSIEVRSGDFFAVPDTTNNSNILEHYYKNESYYFERVTFKDEAAENVVKFINNNIYTGITVKLKGKTNYQYKLSNTDTKAITDSYHLWIVKKDILRLEQEKQKSKIKINKINARKSNKLNN